MSTQRNNPIAKAIRFALIGGAAVAAVIPAYAADEATDEDEQRIEVTGSRIKRTDLEGALPVTVIDREDIDMSGDVSVADLLRSTTFNTFGSFRPQSGSSAQSVATVDLRGLGSSRTLVLIDGRRAPKGPSIGSSSDINTIPLAAVERIEILSDGASAIYGSDAIGGVVNVITRKDFNGVELRMGMSNPRREGGDTEEGSVVFGSAGDKGSMMGGISYNKRDIVFARDRPWSSGGASIYSNNWYDPAAGTYNGYLDGGCNGPGFTAVGDAATGTCFFDFTQVSADEAETELSSAFMRSTYEINDDWSSYFNASVSRSESFGRYAPAAAVLSIAADNPINPHGRAMLLLHRYAPLGNRDTTTDNNVYDFNLGFTGNISDTVEIDFGIRNSDSKFIERGSGYAVLPIAAQYARCLPNQPCYDPRSADANDPETTGAMQATIGRDSFFKTREAYAVASMDLFEMGGGVAALAVGVEARKEDFQDQYDSLSEAGVIGGSAGNSSGGTRDVDSLFFEVGLPLIENLEVSVAGRYEDYSDYGSDFAPKVSVRFQPIDEVTLRASVGEGFRAPTLDILSAKLTFSADFINDERTCEARGLIFDNAQNRCENAAGQVQNLQVNAFSIGNPDLKSEQSDQWSVGVAWEPTDWINMSLDYANIVIEDRITQFDSQALLTLENRGQALPAGLAIIRSAVTGGILSTRTGFGNEGEIEAEYLDLNVKTKFDFGGAGRLENNLQIAHVVDFAIDGDDDYIGVSTGDAGYPEFNIVLSNSWSVSDFNVAWNIRYIDSLEETAAKLDSWTTHDIQFAWNTPWNGQLAFGATNVTDEDPVESSLASRGFNFNLYDGYGRVPYLRYTQTF